MSAMDSPEEPLDENKLIALRRQKLNELRQLGNAYPCLLYTSRCV